MKGIGDLMKQAQEVQSRLTDVQNEMAKIEVTGESGAGLVQVIMNCRYGVMGVSIDSSLFDEEKQMLEDLVAAACNDAVKKVEQTQAEKMSELTGGLNLPFGNLGG
jgi:DNA-binding YbaB/EbfC family protein|tara:strand:+ start:305 stop:622 length:318 start_codon:yes stop_codon:yes gene_type:complete